jgi:hypothetical protein
MGCFLLREPIPACFSDHGHGLRGGASPAVAVRAQGFGFLPEGGRAIGGKRTMALRSGGAAARAA